MATSKGKNHPTAPKKATVKAKEEPTKAAPTKVAPTKVATEKEATEENKKGLSKKLMQAHIDSVQAAEKAKNPNVIIEWDNAKTHKLLTTPKKKKIVLPEE